MNHLETLIGEYLEWRGYLLRRNVKVGRLSHGGWAMELDVIGYNPISGDLVHYEPSTDADSWAVREKRYAKKMHHATEHILKSVFPWLASDTVIRHIAVLPNHTAGHDLVGGMTVQSIDELIAEIRSEVRKQGLARQNAIPENYPLLRTLQLAYCGYQGAKP